MKTLKESLLDDIDVTMKSGNKMMKEIALAEKELEYIQKRISDFNASTMQWYSGAKTEYKHRLTMRVDAKRLAKYFNLPAKNIFFMLAYDQYKSKWHMRIILTSASKTQFDKRTQAESVSFGYMKATLGYEYNDSGKEIPPREFIMNYLYPMFENMQAFEHNIIEPLKNQDGGWLYSKWMPVQNI